jgi:acetyltransferase-like isoleucine patch superfamily enzyme
MRRVLPGDWYDGEIPANVVLEPGAYVETSFCFAKFCSRRLGGLTMGPGSSAYGGTMFDVGPEGRVEVGRYAMLNSVHIVCDAAVEIGDHTLISWNVVLMDSYREPLDPELRRRYRQEVAAGRSPSSRGPVHPIRIGSNVWIGFDSCILPGVSVGQGSVVGARSVVTRDVPPYMVVAGNPARVVRVLPRPEGSHAQVRI